MSTKPSIQDAMSEVLDALGFAAMARDVKAEREPERLRRYARVCVKHCHAAARERLRGLFYRAKLL